MLTMMNNGDPANELFPARKEACNWSNQPNISSLLGPYTPIGPSLSLAILGTRKLNLPVPRLHPRADAGRDVSRAESSLSLSCFLL